MSSPLKSSSRTQLSSSSAFLTAAFALVLGACGDDDGGSGNVDGSVSGSIDAGTSSLDGGYVANTDGGVANNDPPSKPNLYVIATAVTVADTTTTYVKSVTDIDAKAKLDLKGAVTAAGFGDIHIVGDKLYVTDAEKPIVSRYTVNADGSFKADADPGAVNFSMYATTAPIYNQAFASDTKAYLKTATDYVVWNPQTMKITGTIAAPAEITAREGINPFYAYDRAFHARGNRIFHAVSYLDYVNYKMTATSSVVVIDTDNDKVVKVLEVDCPAIDTITEDDKGDLYLSGWVFAPGATLVNGGAKSCIRKIAQGSETVDPDFKLTPADVSGGHEGVAFRWVSGSKFLMAVFHEEKAPYDPKKQQIAEWLQSGTSWTFATYDIATKQFSEVPSLGSSSGGYYSQGVDDRFYVLVPGAGYTTTTYQQLLPDNTAQGGLSMDGWSTRVYPVRK